MQYQHAEAFCLMWYACGCGHRERIWNSRDGVTPFGGVGCTSCARPQLRHVNWALDERAPDHRLTIGQRYFRDGTADDAVAIVEDQVARAAASGHPIPDDIADMLRAHARAQTGEWRAGWPKVDTWDAAKAAKREAA